MSGRVFGYIRTSTPVQTVAEQQHALDEWAAAHDRTLARTFIDDGVSGAIPFRDRPAGARLWRFLRHGDVVVAAWLDRLFRRADDCLTVTEALQKRGVSLYLFDFNDGADDVSGGLSRMIIHVASAFAEHERMRITQRIRAAKKVQKARGEYLGGPPPFGYRHDAERKLVPVPEQQRELRRIHKLHADGLSPYKISADLAGRGVKLSHVTVRKIIAGRRSTAPGSAAA